MWSGSNRTSVTPRHKRTSWMPARWSPRSTTRRSRRSALPFAQGNDTIDLGNVLEPSSGIVVNGGGGSNTLIGSAVPDTLSLTGENSGNGTGLTFRNAQNLISGPAGDVFAFQPTGSIDGTITGQGGNNTLDYSAYAADVNVSLALQTGTATTGFSGTATAIGGGFGGSVAGFNQIQHLLGSNNYFNPLTGGYLNGYVNGQIALNGYVNTLVGPNLNTTWTLTGNNVGSLVSTGNSLAYTLDWKSFANLEGGSAQRLLQVRQLGVRHRDA